MLSKFPLHISFGWSFVQRALIKFHQPCLTLTNFALCGEMPKCPTLSIASRCTRELHHTRSDIIYIYIGAQSSMTKAVGTLLTKGTHCPKMSLKLYLSAKCVLFFVQHSQQPQTVDRHNYTSPLYQLF